MPACVRQVHPPTFRRCFVAAAVAVLAACSVETPPLEASDDYLPLTGGQITGDVAVSGEFRVTDTTASTSRLTVHPNGNVGIGDVAGSLLGVRAPAGHLGPLLAVSDEVGQEALVVQKDRHVGIGMIDPASWLHVRGATSQVLSDGIRVDRDGQCAQYQWTTLNFRGGRARLTSTIINGPGACALDSKGGFSFTASDANGPIDRMTIDEQGRIGIGTNSPDAALDVNGLSVRIRTPMSPNSSSAPCETGEVAWGPPAGPGTGSYLYACTAPNHWKRAALSDF